MNAYPPVSIAPATAVLACLSGLAWTAAMVIAVVDLTGAKTLAVSIGLGITTAVSAVVLECSVRLIRKMEEHAQRVEAATAQHAELLSKHVLALDRFFEMGVHSDRASNADAKNLKPWNPHSTGPFRVYNGDAG